MPGVRVRRVGARFFIEGGVASEGDAKRIEKIAALYPGQVESLVVAGGGGVADRKVNIRLDFFFIRYDKTSGYAVGVDWPGRIGGPGVVESQFTYDFLAGTTTTAEASVVSQPLPALDIASRRGWAKVLKQSTVITVNGTKALWESGGEQNFPISSGLSANIKEITFGTKVEVLPRLDEQTGELEIQVDADVSDLTPPVESTNLPGRNISKLKTLVRLKLGQSLVLSGIRSTNRRHDIRGLPILSEIPVLGVLFGSHRDSGEDVEGALFIIPTAVESVPKPAHRDRQWRAQSVRRILGGHRSSECLQQAPAAVAQGEEVARAGPRAGPGAPWQTSDHERLGRHRVAIGRQAHDPAPRERSLVHRA